MKLEKKLDQQPTLEKKLDQQPPPPLGLWLLNLPLAYMRMNPGYSFSALERKTTVRMLDVDSIPSSVMLPHASSRMAPVADVPVNQRCDELSLVHT